MRSRTARLAPIALLAAAAAARAELPVAELDRTEPVSYAKEIAPAFKRSCLACHNANKAKAGLDLESVEKMLAGSDDGPVIVPGKSAESFLFLCSTHREDPVMPPENNKANAPDLTPEELALLARWIDEGAEDDSSAADTPPVQLATLPDGIDAIYSVALSPDSRYAAAGRGNRVALYHLPGGQHAGELVDPALSAGGAAAHLDQVGALAFGGDDLLATGGFRNVKIWRRADGALRAVLKPAGDTPGCATASPDGALAAVGDHSGGLALYAGTAPNDEPKRFKDHAARVTGAAFSADGSLVTAAMDRTLRVRAASGEGGSRTVAELPSPVTALALIAGGTRAACGCEDGAIRVVTLADGAVAEAAGAHGSAVAALAAAGAGGTDFLSGGADGKVKRWAAGDLTKAQREADHGAPVRALVAASDGTRFATLDDAGKARLWDAAELKPVGELKADAEAQLAVQRAESAAGVADGLRDLRKKALEEATKKWDEELEKSRAATAAEDAAKMERDAKLAALRTAEEAHRAAAAEAAAIAAQGADAGAANNAAKAAEDALNKARGEADEAARKLAEAADNTALAVRFAGRAGTAKAEAEAAAAAAEAGAARAAVAVEAAKAALPDASRTFRALTFSVDGALLFAAAEGGATHRWFTSDGAPAGHASLGGGAVAALAATPDGGLLSAADDKGVRLADPRPRWALERTIGAIDDPETFADRINTVAFSPDGELLATGGGVPSRSGELKLWRVRDGSPVAANSEEHSDAISAVAFSPDGRHLATAATDRFVKVFSAADLAVERAFEGHTNHVLDVAWRADGLALASSGADNVVKVWDFETGAQKQTVTGHSKPVTAVAFVGAGETLLSSSGDQSVRLANQPLPDAGTFMHSAAASPDGKLVAAGGEDSVLRVWQADKRAVLLKLQ